MPFQTGEQLKRLDIKLKRELGPCIVDAFDNPDITDICVNSDGRIWFEGKGKRLYDTSETILPENLAAALGTIASMNGLEVNESNPILECRNPLDGSRVEGALPPVSPDGPSMTIRKHSSYVFPLEKYVAEQRVTPECAEFIRDSIRNAKNIVVAGGTSSGKTTFVNALIRELLDISPKDRLLLMEDTQELQCATTNKQNFVTAENVPMRKLLKTAMRYRPDRIIVGEVRGGEALDLLKAWNTGHPGGLATLHANNAAASLLRLEQLVAEASAAPMPRLVAEAVNVVVYMREFGAIGRRVTEIIEVTGYREGEYMYKTVYECAERNVRKNG